MDCGTGDRRLPECRDDEDCGHAVLPAAPLPPRFPCRACQEAAGFTILEIIVVLFLLAGVLTMVVPRFVIGDDLGAAGRKFIGAIRSLQSLAAAGQKPVKLYVDLDQQAYWAVVVDGRDEKPPADAVWASRYNLPEPVRMTDLAVGESIRRSGRGNLMLYPNGRIDAGTVYLTDGNNGVLAIVIEPVTGAISTSDERIGPVRKPAIPDRIKTLLQPVTIQGGLNAPGGL